MQRVLVMQMLFERVSFCLKLLTKVLDAGASVDKQDHRQWSALMWATTNSQPQIVRLLLDHGASPAVKTGAGRTALDFIGNDTPNREIEGYLRTSNGNDIGSVGVSDDWYDKGFGGEIEEQYAESERKRRMMMESAFNLEVDISSLGLDEPPEVHHYE
jgi:ankyrin repeat protein